MKAEKKEKILQLLQEKGVLRPRDLEQLGISGIYLNKLYAEGVLDRPSRGLYTLPEVEPSENRTLAEVCKLVPKGVVCLLTALRFHELTTQSPFEVWLAISRDSRVPRIDYPPIRIVRFSEESLAFGVQEQMVEGVAVNMTSPAKTVADCFKYRNKIGLDVPIEALRDCMKKRKATYDEIWTAAKVCRMANVMRPYLEAIA